jgi:hypothetical protein
LACNTDTSAHDYQRALLFCRHTILVLFLFYPTIAVVTYQ